MTNKAFASEIGVTDSYASYLRNGQRLPSGDLLVKIILTFDLPRDPAMNAYREGATAFGKFLQERVFDGEPSPVQT